jgi:hypothetical protein
MFVIKNKVTQQYVTGPDVMRAMKAYFDGTPIQFEDADVANAQPSDTHEDCVENMEAYCEMCKKDKNNYEVVEVQS